jgi:hypothetical protein
MLRLLLLSLAAAVAGRNGRFRRQAAVLVANDKLALTVLIESGSLASLVLKDDPGKLNRCGTRPGSRAGTPVRARGGTGHFVCVEVSVRPLGKRRRPDSRDTAKPTVSSARWWKKAAPGM